MVDELVPRIHWAEQRVVQALDDEARRVVLRAFAQMQAAAAELVF